MAVSDVQASPCSYSLPHYRHILQKAKDCGYWFPKVKDVAHGVPDRKLFLVRHDVDITPYAALEMAEVEKSMDVLTTYYFRLHAPYYNLLDHDPLDCCVKIAAMGHEVGLHYEPGFFLDRDQDPVEGTRRDIRIFEELIGQKTFTIAQHQPAEGPVLDDISEAHPCAYQPALVRDMRYFGDSGFHWREGCICTKLGEHEQIHTLIHPHSWAIWDREWQDVLRATMADLGGRVSAEMERYIASVEVYLENRARIDAERAAKYAEE